MKSTYRQKTDYFDTNIGAWKVKTLSLFVLPGLFYVLFMKEIGASDLRQILSEGVGEAM